MKLFSHSQHKLDSSTERSPGAIDQRMNNEINKINASHVSQIHKLIGSAEKWKAVEASLFQRSTIM